jgi:hypothetical protein
MSHHWPPDCRLEQVTLEVEDRACPHCARAMHVCDHRIHRIFTLDGPRELVCKLVHCPDRACPGHRRTVSPESELGIAPPFWAIGWDVFCWVGHRRLARHWGVPQIRAELADSHDVRLSDDAVEKYVRRYQTMLAARHQDPQLLAEEYRRVKGLVLTIDGLQPEKGHETLYVVRELSRRRVWFAQSLLSSSASEVQRLLELARDWALRLDRPVTAWVSDKQDAFVTGIAAVFPGVPHRYCQNHFLRELAKPVLEVDAAAKVRMRSKVRGLRAIERQILAEAAQAQAQAQVVGEPAGPEESPSSSSPSSSSSSSSAEPAGTPAADDVMPAGEPAAAAAAAVAVPAQARVALDYCAAVRGILNDGQGGPLRPPGLAMADALAQVGASIQRNLAAAPAEKGGPPRST